MVLLFRTGHWLMRRPDLLNGSEPLYGPDAYLRLARVADWLNGDAWYATAFPLLNPPDGLHLHWTRLMDLLLAAGALPLSLFLPLEQALLYWGGFISPVLAGLTVIALSPLLRPMMGAGWFLFLVFFVMGLQPTVISYTFVGRPDHHALLLLLFTLSFSLTVRDAMEPSRRFLPGLAGITAALGLWVSPEALVGIGITLAVPGLIWLATGDRRALWSAATFTSALATGVTLALTLERPFSGWMQLDLDRLSLVHWALVLAMAGTLEGIRRIPQRAKRSVPWRIWLSLWVVGLPATVMAVFFPRFFHGPYADLDPAIVDIWFRYISEIQSLIPTDLLSLGETVLILGPGLPALLFGVWLFRTSTEAPQARIMALAILVSLGGFTALSLHENRWAMYFGLVVGPPLILLLKQIMAQGPRLPLASGPGVPLRAPLFLLIFLWHPVMFGILVSLAGTDKAAASPTVAVSCDWQKVGALLRQQADRLGRPLILFSENDQGPLLMYQSGQPVISGPYHRHSGGIFDTYRFFNTTDDKEAEAIARRWHADYVVFCPKGDWQKDGPALGRRLAKGWVPNWLVKIPSLMDEAALTVYRLQPPNS